MSGDDPLLETPKAELDAALVCGEFVNPDKEPVLLVHGTSTRGEEQYAWNYRPWLEAQGFDVCTVTYPHRGLGDQQIAAEYVVHAVRTIAERSGSKVDMVGHSQGGSMPRWAIKWWPESVQANLDDFVLHAAPVHGTSVASFGVGGSLPEAFWQFRPDSNFVAALNAGDETPGEIDYTSIYTLTDELVQPQFPESTAALELGQDNPRVSNILMQDLCPTRVVEHLSIGTIDEAVALITVDALIHDGPADPERAGGMALCSALQIADSAAIPAFFAIGPESLMNLPTDFRLSSEEPPLKPYAQGE